MVCICLGLALILLSGHRLFIATVCLFAILLWRLTTRPSVAMVAGAASIAVVAWMAVSLADQLPSSAQRALSFVPGVADDTEVGEQATTTIDWRLEVWRNEGGGTWTVLAAWSGRPRRVSVTSFETLS